MTPTRLLHLLLVLVLVLLIVALVKTYVPETDVTRVLPHLATPSVPVLPQAPTPKPLERWYAPMPVLWERRLVTVELAMGDIKTPPAPVWPLKEKRIEMTPATVKLPWVFGLP